jgi:glycosyltransferase involved in cell wall biosynthesis
MQRNTGNRVLLAVENKPYPQDTRVYSEAQALHSAGYDVSVISPACRRQPWYEVLEGVRVYRFPASFEARRRWGYVWEYGYSMAAIFLLSALVCLREGFDVLHAANPPDTLVFIASFYKLFGKRFVFDHHDLSPELYCANFAHKEGDVIYRILLWLERLSCRLADHVIATNESYEKLEVQRAGIRPERITVVRNGPDLTRFARIEPNSDLRQMGKTVIAYAGSIALHDGVDYLIRALGHLAFDLQRRDFVCLVIGKGEFVAELKALTTKLGLDEHVRFLGWLSHSRTLECLSAADICVDPDPSNHYNDRSTMIKIGEYMALGKPIVAFDLVENRFTAQEAALFVSGNDEMQFARGIAQLMDDPLRRQAMGQFGRQRVEKELAWSYSVPRLLSVYGSLLRSRGEPSHASELIFPTKH